MSCDLVGHCAGALDISVLAPKQQLTPLFPLDASTDGLVIGQRVFFLGYPYGAKIAVASSINSDYPLPFVKGGIISGVEFSGDKRLWVDGYNNPGFSGGPIVYTPSEKHPASHPFQLAGIVSGYPSFSEVVVDGSGKPTGHFIKNNPGILLGTNVAWALTLIDANPIGFKIA